MAISKIIYKQNAQDTGTVWMDVSQKTVTAGTMLNGTTALKNDGTDITGNIVSKTSSDLTANVLTVTAPAGHYASNATKTLTDQYLLAENIKKDISIFGVTGTYEGGGGGTSWEIVYSESVSIQDWGDDVNYVTIPNYFQTHSDFAYGETYRVTWNGNQYVCTISEACPSFFGIGYLIGNANLVSAGSDTGEPFCGANTDNSSVGLIFATTSPTGTFNLIIEKQVSGGGSTGLEYETGTWTPASDVENEWIDFANVHTTEPIFAMMEDADMSTVTDGSWTVCYFSLCKNFYGTAGTFRGSASRRYYTLSSGHTGTNQNLTTDTIVENYISTEKFRPNGSTTGYYWRSGRTYKWIAVWAPTT